MVQAGAFCNSESENSSVGNRKLVKHRDMSFLKIAKISKLSQQPTPCLMPEDHGITSEATEGAGLAKRDAASKK